MNNATTFVGLDVHARSVKACAFVPETGETIRKSFGYQTARRASIRHALSTGIPEEIDWAKDEEIRPWPFIAY